MRVLIRGLLLGLIVPATAYGQIMETFGLTPGVRATVQIEGSAMRVTDSAPEQPSDFDRAMTAALNQAPTPDRPVESTTVQHLDDRGAGQPAPGQVSFHFSRIQNGKQSLLVIENGYDRALVYRARMHVGNRETPTDVCLVPPHARGYELWPHPIDQIDLSAMRLVEWGGGKEVPCA